MRDVNEIVGMARKARSLMTRGELVWLCELAKLAPNGTGVEVGVYHGASLIAWSFMREGRGEAIGVDNWQVPNMAAESGIRKACQHNLDTFHAPARLMEGNSVDVAAQLPDDLAFVFIDGNHYSPDIDDDVRTWTPKIASGGVAAFHDYGRAKFDVTRVLDDWLAREKWRIIGRVESTIGFLKP